MRIYNLILLVLVFGLLSCKKEKNEQAAFELKQDQKNQEQIVQYIAEQNLDMQKDKSGMYYKIEGASGKLPDSIHNQLTIKYIIKLLDGTVIDDLYDEDAINFAFGSKKILSGIQKGVRKMSKGNKATFLLPNKLAYGSSSNTNLPPYAVVKVEIELIDIRTEDDLLKKYMSDHNLTPTKELDGMYYVELGTTPFSQNVSTDQDLTINYQGFTVDGKVFDSSDSFSVKAKNVSGLIAGWQKGLYLMKTLDEGYLLIPSSLGYGTYGKGNIPPNTPLVFKMTIIKAEKTDR